MTSDLQISSQIQGESGDKLSVYPVIISLVMMVKGRSRDWEAKKEI